MFFSRCNAAGYADSPRSSRRRSSYDSVVYDECGFPVSGWDDSGSATRKLQYSKVGKFEIPTGYAGYYEKFISPHDWSSVFSSPGDFTLKLVNVVSQNGQFLYRFAILCSFLLDPSGKVFRGKETERLKSYVQFIQRTEKEIKHLAETISFKTPGHDLLEHFPKQKSVSLQTTVALRERGHEMVSFISKMLSITHVGHNKMVELIPSIIMAPNVRVFFAMPLCSIALESNMMGITSTNSCAARIEKARVQIPTDWTTRSKSISSEPEFSGISYKAPMDPLVATHYVSPSAWKGTNHLDNGMFTVEISRIYLEESHAKYRITVLSFVNGQVVRTEIDRRYTEFYQLAVQVSHVSKVDVFAHLPPKTLFRYQNIQYLQRRSSLLQHFLEKMLRVHFLGTLGEVIEISAEPNVRTFLQLPPVKWNLVPKF